MDRPIRARRVSRPAALPSPSAADPPLAEPAVANDAEDEIRQWRALGARMQRLREIAGMSQEEAAEALGVHQMTLSRYERGVRPFPVAAEARLVPLYAERTRQTLAQPTGVVHASPQPPSPEEQLPGYWRGRHAEITAALRRVLASLEAFDAAGDRWEHATVSAALAHAAPSGAEHASRRRDDAMALQVAQEADATLLQDGGDAQAGG